MTDLVSSSESEPDSDADTIKLVREVTSRMSTRMSHRSDDEENSDDEQADITTARGEKKRKRRFVKQMFKKQYLENL